MNNDLQAVVERRQVDRRHAVRARRALKKIEGTTEAPPRGHPRGGAGPRERWHGNRDPPARESRLVGSGRASARRSGATASCSCRWPSSALLHLSVRICDLHQLLQLGDPREAVEERARTTTATLYHDRSSAGRSRTRSTTRRRRAARDGARALDGARRQPGDPRPGVLPLGVLLPGDRLVGRDHGDRDLHPQRERPRQPDRRRPPVVVRRPVHRALVDRRA